MDYDHNPSLTCKIGIPHVQSFSNKPTSAKKKSPRFAKVSPKVIGRRGDATVATHLGRDQLTLLTLLTPIVLAFENRGISEETCNTSCSSVGAVVQHHLDQLSQFCGK